MSRMVMLGMKWLKAYNKPAMQAFLRGVPCSARISGNV